MKNWIKYNNVINVLHFIFLCILSYFLIISKEKIKEKNEKGRNLEDIYFMVFMFVTPAPLIRKKEGKRKVRTRKEKGEISENNCNQWSSFHVLLSSFAYFPGHSGRKKQMKTREAPECSCFYVTLMHLKRKKLEMERCVSDALHFLFSKLFW